MSDRIPALLARAVPAAALTLALAALGSSSSCGGGSTPVRMVAENGRLHDASGREILLHGVNARVDGIFDVSFDDGRTKLEEIPPFVEEDCRFLGEDLGLDHLRLPVNWSAIEPNPDDYREDYVDRILAIAAMCDRHGVQTLVDFHQDAYSKEIGEDGAPLWAIVPAPTMLLEGPLDDLEARRASVQVNDAFETFFNDTAGGWGHFSEMAAWVAQRIDGKPGVIGLELYNEPILFFADETLHQFHTHVLERVRAVAPNLTVFFEPAAIRNITDVDPLTPAFGQPNTVYAPHVYTDVFEGGYDPAQDATKLTESVASARAAATAHGAALYVGEFGEDDSARGAAYMTDAMEAFDDELASWAFWVYEEWSQGSWGLYDATASDPPTRGALRMARARLVARAYPTAVAGHLTSVDYDDTTRTLTVMLTDADDGLDHVFSAPALTYPDGVRITCDGTEVSARVAAGRARFRCAGSVLVMTPAP